MDYSYDDRKDAELKRRRGVGFEDIVNIFFKTHYWELKNDNPEQYLAIGELDGQFWSIVYEEWEDELGELVWLVTFWPSTPKKWKGITEMASVNKKDENRSIDSIEEAVISGQDISDQHFSPGGVSAGRTRGKRRKLSNGARKVSAYRRNIDYGEALFQDLVSISGELNISLQALAKMALQEWVMRYREHQESKQESPENKPAQTS